jgi:hypothetical protein
LKEIVFVRSTHKYDSYTDFWQLVELSGFPTIYENELDITQPGNYIVSPMNGNYLEHMIGDIEHWRETGEALGGQIERRKISGMPRRAHIIIWNLERPSGSGNIDQYGAEGFKWIYTRVADEVWVSDPALADETMLRYVVLGSDYGLGEPSDEKIYDLTHMSLPNPRRQQIYKHFNGNQIGPNCWPWDDPSRDDVLKASRFALNVHQDNCPFCEPLRFALFAANGLPIISETLRSGYPYGGDIQQFPFHNLADGLKACLNDDYGRWREMGLKLRKKLCEDFQFKKMVVQAIEESTGIRGWR